MHERFTDLRVIVMNRCDGNGEGDTWRYHDEGVTERRRLQERRQTCRAFADAEDVTGI